MLIQRLLTNAAACFGLVLGITFFSQVTAAPEVPSLLTNFSSRGPIQAGPNYLIGGFIIEGEKAKTVLIRARGPSLPLTGTLVDPTLRLFSRQTVIAANDDWQSAANAADIQATGKAPSHPKEAAILITLDPGPYTAIVNGVNHSTGIGIVEVLDVDTKNKATQLVNLSSRGPIQAGPNHLIGGFIIEGEKAKTVLIRARGPSLPLTGTLVDPTLRLFSRQTVIAANDDWQSAANAADIQATGKAPSHPKEAAILITLDPGPYTAIVNGVNHSTGIGIVEVLDLTKSIKDRCETPYVKLVRPLAKHIQSGLELAVSADACFPPFLPSGGVKFTLNGEQTTGGTEATVTTPPYTHTFSDLASTEYTLTASLVDHVGHQPIGGANTQDEVFPVGIGDYYVALGDSITAGVGDDIVDDNTSQDGRNVAPGYTPILNDLLTVAFGYPHTVVDEGVPGIRSRGGLEQLPGVIEKHPEAQFYLIQYGTNDSGGQLPVPSGLGLMPGEPGYADSYKDNMQQILDTLTAAGKLPYLAKVPSTFRSATRNALITEYNQVVEELVLEHGIAVTPPDFFSHFQANRNEFSDSLHPNGVGYQSMAELWFNSLQ